MICMAVLGSPALFAESVRYTLGGTFTMSDVPTSISVGDRYALTFLLDDTVVDINADASLGNFAHAVRELSFTLLSSAVGTYAGGSLTSTGLYAQIDTYHPSIPDGAWLGLSAADDSNTVGFSFGDADGGLATSLLEFALVPYLPETIMLDEDVGQTLGSVVSQLALGLYDQDAPANGVRLYFGGLHGSSASATIDSITLTAIPEPAAYAPLMMLTALLYAGAARRRPLGATR